MRSAEAIYADINKDESRVLPYRLPALLQMEDGERVASAGQWLDERRPQLLRQFADTMYGSLPPPPDSVEYEVISERADALGGIALRREVRIRCRMENGREHTFMLLLYLPLRATEPVPAFIGLNFNGNQSCTSEPDVLLTSAQLVIPERNGWFVSGRADASSRGEHAGRWAFEQVIARGYASATIHYSELFPDRPDGFADSVLNLFAPRGHGDHAEGADFDLMATVAGQVNSRHERGAIAAWAWGLTRGLEYLLTEPRIDPQCIAVHGHSRLGKTALYAGACEPRFAMVISNNSGCCGAALAMRNFGENLEWLLHWRTYWFNTALRAYINREAELPFDQHALLALIAPRLLYVASASEDASADPLGEFLAARYAGEVYRLFGKEGISQPEPPVVNHPVGDCVGYHIREGKHSITPFDWQCFLDFADRHWR